MMAAASDRVAFDIDGLDAVLMGGLVRHNNLLLEGRAGAGKTTLALAFLYAGAAKFQEPGLLISFECSPEKLLRDARGFGWNFEQLAAQSRVKLIETSPAVLLEDVHVEDGVLAHELRALGAKRLVIDGLTPLRLASESATGGYRQALHQLVESLSRLGITTLLTGESDGASSAQLAHERYLFDTVISLERSTERATHRTLEVIKARGQDFIAGRHTLRLESDRGVAVYQRAASRHVQPPARLSNELHTFGSPAIDALFGGGLYGGSITMVSGIAGTGKTVAALQFLTAGAELGQIGLLVSVDEAAAQLCRNAETLGFPASQLLEQKRLFILYDSPLELELDVHFDRITRLIDERGVRRVVFDSLALYGRASPKEATGFLYALAAFCKARNMLVIFNYESPELLGVSQISEPSSGSQLVDNIVLLSYVEVSTNLRRAIAVPKVRGRHNVQVTREYVIERGGLQLLAEPELKDSEPVPQLPFSRYYGLLARAPARRSPAIDEAVAAGDPMPESSAPRSGGTGGTDGTDGNGESHGPRRR
jgi:circadian clock protein KaiC